MKRKQLLALLLALCLLLCALAACKKDAPSDPGVDPGQQDTPTPDNPDQPSPDGKEIDGDQQSDDSESPAPEIHPTREELLEPQDDLFCSRTSVTYENINGGPVTVYSFYRDTHERGNNPNFAQAVLIYQCLQYKLARPEEDVFMTVSSFHLSIALSACVVPGSPDYGSTRNIYDADYTEDGYYRLSYLLVEAARNGIEVTVIAQLNAAGTLQEDGTKREDFSFVSYFTPFLSEPSNIPGKKIGDFMTFRPSYWTCYNNKPAADMMHNKVCTVSNFLDADGVAFWTGSINLDGVNYLDQNGNDSIQTAVLVEGHEALRRIAYNYTRILADYCDQEDAVPFRVRISAETTRQVDLLTQGRGNEIAPDEQIVYLGTENDPVFELYFTPFGGSFSTWEPTYNPYIKYFQKLMDASKGSERIELIWNNVKYVQTFELANMITEAIAKSFEDSANPDNVLWLHLPGVDGSYFSDLYGEDGFSLNETSELYHSKDLQLSYVEDGVRYYVSVLNSLNFHEGSMFHQTNTVLVIKERDEIGNDFYIDYITITTPGLDIRSRRVTE